MAETLKSRLVHAPHGFSGFSTAFVIVPLLCRAAFVMVPLLLSFTRLELFVMVPLLSARVPFRPRVCPFRVHVVRRLCVGFASGVVRLCVPHVKDVTENKDQ